MRTKERLLSAIVDIQIHIKHDIDQHACAACLRWDELQAAAMKACDEIDRLRAEVEALRALLAEAADELKDSYDLAYPDRQKYPDKKRRYERDMDLVNRIRGALRGEGE